MIQLNLLPDVKKEYIKAQRTKATVVSASILVTFGSIALAILLFVIVYVAQPGLIGFKQGEIDEKSENLRSVEDIDKYLTIQNQLEALPELHDGKVIYSRLFGFLKVLNPAPPNNIRLSTLQVDEENKIILFTGVTSGFQAFSVFQDTLRNAEVTYKNEAGEEVKEKLFTEDGITIQSQSLATNQGKQELNFTVEATYSETAFSPATDSPKLTIPNIKTTQSITGTPGRSTAPLFDEDAAPEGGEQ